MVRPAIAIVGVLCALTSALAQGPAEPAARSSGAKAWAVPRTADGRPDLQGSWTNETLTPLERPTSATGLVMSEDEAERLEKNVEARRERLAQPSDPNRPAPPQGGDGSTGAAGNVGGYNNFWLAPGERVARIDGRPRASLIVDPADGRVPPLTPEAQQRQRDRLAANRRFGQYDHPELRPLAERCLTSFGSNAGPPMLPNYFYNNNYQIVQSRDHVMILVEMVHDVRTIRLVDSPSRVQHLPKHLRPWYGDSVGWWEADTLVVETTNFHPLQVFRGASESLKVTERFTRTAPDVLLYKFTIDDPTTFTRAWTGEVPFSRMDGLIYEYACHEGNYALSNVLSGERAREREDATKKPQ